MLENTLIFSLTANKELTDEVASILGLPVSPVSVNHFADGEIICEPGLSVRDKNVFVIQSTCGPVTEHLFEILIFVDALKRASAREINVVIPYYGYARQDRKSKPRQPITSKLVANLLSTAGVDRVISFELHAPQIQGFFDCLVDELSCTPLIADHFRHEDLSNTVIVSPDHGGVNRARRIAESLNLPLAIIDKRRTRPNVAEVMNIIGNVEGKDCLLIDDIIDTAGSCSEGAKALKANGAKRVRIACVHGIFSGKAKERIFENFDEVVTTNSIPLKEEMVSDKVKVLSLGPMIAGVIEHIVTGLPLSTVYDIYN